MMIALAGGTGFTGRRVAARLAHDGYDLRCLIRAGSDSLVLPGTAKRVVGDLSDTESLATWLDGAEALIYTASMGFGHVAGVVAAAERAGVRRAVFVSTTAIFTKLKASSKACRLEAEDQVRSSHLEWTILRPTMIYGAPGDRNMERLLRSLRRWGVIVVPGSGKALLQPVHVEDLADVIVTVCSADAASRKAYDISGREPLTFNAVIDTAATAVGRRCRKFHVPLIPAATILRWCEKVRLPLPVKSEQVLRLGEDKAFSHAPAARDIGYAPRGFEAGIADEARLLGYRPGP